MTNNLRQISKDLRAFAKRTKDFKYTEAALIAFVMTGIFFRKSNLFAAQKDSTIQNQVSQINTSINQIRTEFKKARKENDKLVKNTNLELIQLMEQGDHVVKSPWSSWQYGMNYIYNDWHGTYKGRGDKESKYPYSGIFERSTNVYERTISPDSSQYGLLSKNRRPNFASGSSKGFGIASFKPVKEPIVPFEVNAGIRPRSINKSAIRIADKTAVTPTLPEAISFTPPKPVIGLPQVPELPAPPTFNLKLGSFCNGMSGCGPSDNGGAHSGVGRTFGGSDQTLGSTDVTDGSPAIRYSWATPGPAGYGSFDSTLLKAYFDVTGGGTVTLGTNLTIDSVRGSITDPDNSRTWNKQPFLVGGARIATLDNASNGSIVNNATVNLVGPLVAGFEVQSDTIGSGVRSLRNDGTITDDGEKNNSALNSALAKGNELDLDLPPYAWDVSGVLQKIKIKRTSEGFTGYKVGLIMTYENDDTGATSEYKLVNNGTIKFTGEKSIGIQIYAPGSASYVNVANNTGKTITMGGIESYGMKWSSRVAANSTMINAVGGTINVSGDAGVDNKNKPINSLSSGIAVIENSNSTGASAIRAYQGKVKNAGTINVSGGKGNTGMVLIAKADDNITNSGEINVNSTAGKQNIAMRVDKGRVTTDAANETPKAINDGTINLDGDSSIGMVGTNADVVNNANKTIGTTSGKNIVNGIGMATSGGSLTNNGTITLEGTGVSSNVGAYMTEGTGNPTGTFGSGSAITVKGTDSTGVLITNGTLSYQGTTEAQGDGVTGLLVGDNGSKTATVTAAGSGTVTVNGGNAATSAGVYENATTKVKKGSYGIVVGKGVKSCKQWI